MTRITKEYDHPIIEITESGCGYLDGPRMSMDAFQIRGASSGIAST